MKKVQSKVTSENSWQEKYVNLEKKVLKQQFLYNALLNVLGLFWDEEKQILLTKNNEVSTSSFKTLQEQIVDLSIIKGDPYLSEKEAAKIVAYKQAQKKAIDDINNVVGFTTQRGRDFVGTNQNNRGK